MDNLPRQTTDGKLIAPYLWARSDANRFFAAMAKYDRDAEPETDERSAADEAYAGLVIAENLITRYGTAEERIERGYQKAMDKLTHYEGYAESRAQVLKMSGEQLLALLDALYGRDNLPDHCTCAQLQAEALRQHEMEWRLPERPANQNQFARVLLTVQKRDVIAEREALKKAERAAQPKTEWLEELDYA